MPELNNDDPSRLIKRSRELTTELFLAALVLCRASLHLVHQGMSELGDSKWELSVSAAGPVPAAGDRLGFPSKLGENVTAAPVQEFPAREAEQPSAAGSVRANLPQAETKACGQHPGSRDGFGCQQHSSCFCSAGKLVLFLLMLLGVSSCCIWC